ncbi:MAG TPA: DnaJ domain-containing protein [Anaerolineales bacterium]|nr:DnaJ domain-containing protein [Anaerolineales bacterium]
MPAYQQDYYALLGVMRDASQEEIKRAYLTAAQKFHPDKNTAAGETELFLGVQQAYEVLSNPKRRAQYDATLPPEKRRVLPYEHRILYSRPNLVGLDEPQMLYLILEIGAPAEARQAPAPPLNVCLVLDRSTSMQGEKMDTVKSAALQVLRNLRQQDILSVVAFSDRAEVIIPAAYLQDRARLEAKIQMIQPSGATEMLQGLELGAREVMRSLDSKRINHIVLLTDGHTYGDEKECLAVASRLAERGIGVSGLGIGEEWNDIFLDVLSTRTGGSSAYIAHPQDIKPLLLEKFNALAHTYAEEVTLELKPLPDVELTYAFRIQPDPSPIPLDQGRLHLGPILQDTSTQLIFEYIIQPKAVKSNSMIFLNGFLKVSIASQPLPVPPLHLRLSRPVSNSPEVTPPPTEIVRALSRLMLYRMQERARKEIEQGHIDAATQQLKALASNLLTQGERSLAQTILLEVDHLQRQHTLSDEGSKKISYGTRALLFASPKKEMLS